MFSQSNNLWSKLVALATELEKGHFKDPHVAVIQIAPARSFLGELDIVAQDSVLLGERDVMQDLNTGLTHVLAYKKPVLACAFLHRRRHSVDSTKQALLIKKVQNDL